MAERVLCRSASSLRAVRFPGNRVSQVGLRRQFYGPTLKAFDAVGEAGHDGLERDVLDLIARFNRAEDGTMAVPSEYLETVIVTRRG
jgi:hypothetical protein